MKPIALFGSILLSLKLIKRVNASVTIVVKHTIKYDPNNLVQVFSITICLGVGSIDQVDSKLLQLNFDLLWKKIAKLAL